MLEQQSFGMILIKKSLIYRCNRSIVFGLQLRQVKTAEKKGLIADDLGGRIFTQFIPEIGQMLELGQIIIARCYVRK